MGGALERVTALALPGKEVQRELATFDAALAQCFKVEDRERLLGIVEAAFGDFKSFNAKVRAIFKKRSSTLDSIAINGPATAAAALAETGDADVQVKIDKDKSTELFA